jgi:kinesin family protein 18/19
MVYMAPLNQLQATGCGKTHTISGTEDDPGIIYATMAELFQRIEERRADYVVDVSLSFLEIYNEEIRDLLALPDMYRPKGGLAMREDDKRRMTVAGLNEVIPKDADEVKAIVMAGNARRTQSPTHANATSSRSHAILQINITQSPRVADVTEERTMATLSIIDLAGSERASATKNMGKRMVEGANINKSLLALGNCINALCEARGRAHIPYRNSKLTRLLKFSLGGNCRTVMIVCVAPTSRNLEDTGNTLAYANRAKEIKTKVSKNVMDVDRHVGQYLEAISRLNEEVRELKAKLAGEMAVENEAAKRRKANALKGVEAIRAEMRGFLEKSHETIRTGATMAGGIVGSQANLEYVRARLKELDQMPQRTSQLETERGLLMTLAAADEQRLQQGNAMLAKAAKTEAMCTNNIRLAQKRKSDEWDECATEMLRLEGATALAEVRAIRAEAERDALRRATGAQAEAITRLVGVLARTNTMVLEGANSLQAEGVDVTDVARSLQTLVGLNDKAFVQIIGESSEACVAGRPSSLPSVAVQLPQVPQTAPQRIQPKQRTSTVSVRPRLSGGRSSSGRRSSFGGLGGLGSPRRNGKTPRKPPSALRQTLSFSPRKPAAKKSLRWKDEAGEGSLDDAGIARALAAAAASSGSGANTSTSTSGEGNSSRLLTPSESDDWEDEVAVDSYLNGSISDWSQSSIGKLKASRVFGTLSAKPSALGSLSEHGETIGRISPSKPPGLSRSLLAEHNGPRRAPSPANSTASTAKGSNSSTNILRLSSSSRSRRNSGIGARKEKSGRRRSSLIPQLSPPEGAKGSYRRPSDPSRKTTLSLTPMKVKTKKLSLMSTLRPSTLRGTGSTPFSVPASATESGAIGESASSASLGPAGSKRSLRSWK